MGDMSITISFFAILTLIGALDYSSVASTIPYLNENAISIIGFLLLVGASAKSAQLFLFTWLPHSMEGKSKGIYMLYKFIFIIHILLLILHITNSFSLITKESLISDININITMLNIIPFNIKDLKLPENIYKPLIGNLLGDGHLRYGNKSAKDNNQVVGNVHYAMTLKSYDYTYHLWENIFTTICTTTKPWPWPNSQTPSQYHFKTKSLIALTLLHNDWYKKLPESNKYIKILPANISDSLSDIGLAHWIMDDGYFDNTSLTVVLCTDNFTLDETLLLIDILYTNFNLVATLLKRIKPNKEICWRIRFSGKEKNLNNLKKIVFPYFIKSMYYKLNL